MICGRGKGKASHTREVDGLFKCDVESLDASSLSFLHSFEVLGFALCLLGFALCRLFSSSLHFAKALLQSAYSSQRLGQARTPEREEGGVGAGSTLTPKVLDHSVSVNSFEVTSALLEG